MTGPPDCATTPTKNGPTPTVEEHGADQRPASMTDEMDTESRASEPGGENTALETDPTEKSISTDQPATARTARRWPSRTLDELSLGLIVLVTVIGVLIGLTAWFAHQAQQARGIQRQRVVLVESGRQAAVNLTTIDSAHVDSDIQRIIHSSTGSFHDEFEKNSAGFVEVVKNAQANSVGTVTEAGIETLSGDTAQILVTVTVKTTNAGVPDQSPRRWRMRITVEQHPDGAKVSNVEFIP